MITIRLAPAYLGLFYLFASTVFAVASERPSFNCATIEDNGDHEIEQLICGDARLAKADRDMATAYKAALARLDDPTRETLKEIQRDYLENRNRRFFFKFEGWKVGMDSPPGWSIAKILKAGRNRKPKVFAWVDADMADRIAILNALGPTIASPAGVWIGPSMELELTPSGKGGFSGTLSYTVVLSHDYTCAWAGTFELRNDHLISGPLNEPDNQDSPGGSIDWLSTGITLSPDEVKEPEHNTTGEAICIPIARRSLLHLNRRLTLHHPLGTD